tara:strand:- start:95 stop:622 length:528 start_codon:yes stop_codon:yes gene_type:complete
MKTKNIERYLTSFGKYIVKQARTNLSKKRKNVNKALYNSISFRVEEDAKGFSLKLFMLDYGKFVDKGVSGNKQIQDYTTYDGRKVESPYKYRSKQPPASILEKWIRARGLKGRDSETGRYITNKSFAFLIARKIKVRGIKSTSFFQRPIGLGLQTFGKDILKAIKQDIIDTVNNN